MAENKQTNKQTPQSHRKFTYLKSFWNINLENALHTRREDLNMIRHMRLKVNLHMTYLKFEEISSATVYSEKLF